MTKTLLLIHGIGCGGEVWTVMRRYLEGAGWTCIAPTLFPEKRVKENPPPDLSNLSFPDYVDDMAARCQAIRDETGEAPAVIGHSMGGLIAQCLAEKGLVSKAVFLTPAQPKDCAKVSLSIAFTFANVILSQKRDKSYKIWKTGFNWGVLNCVPKSKHDEIYRLALYDSGRVYGDITDGVEIETRAIKIPTLTIAASHDRATPAAAVRKVAAKYAAAPVPGDFIEYPDNAHWIVDEPGTKEVAGDIINWLEGEDNVA